MTRLTTQDLTPFYRNSVGVDRLFDRLINQIDTASAGNYPPYDIVKTGEDSYEIHIAVAGFREGDIDIQYHQGRLFVEGKRTDESNESHEYLHKGISGRSFTRTFNLADYVEVQTATVKDGILSIQLERKVPEEQKPKAIAITYQS